MSKSAVRAQRAVMGTLLLIAMVLMAIGYDWGKYIVYFIIFMLYLSAATGFCPSDAIFEKLFGKRQDNI
ncbi:YgaP-like transmembrane domain [Persephonella sp.]|uniref:YgaP-like transmembrane domain n=1 Tax=Persephonella sp. TaxID=2060922 RepID=UPI0026021C46|nr:YgaP-like transmembrane domain [Persephonella sp.]